MKAMILAAGRGERMRPLTDSCPKPLLQAAGKALLVYHIEKLVAVGIVDIVINHAWLGQQIQSHVGNGSQWGAKVVYSAEELGELETAGGILNALPLLGEEPFFVVNGDIWTDYDFACLPQVLDGQLAHLVLVDNPPHNRNGDFALQADVLFNEGESCYTYAGIGVYHPQLFVNISLGKVPLGPLLREYIGQGKISGEKFDGKWTDVGTPERLSKLNEQLR